MSNVPSGPIRTSCPQCLHPLLIEFWTRADTFSGQMVDEVVVLSPVTGKQVVRCPGCRTPLDAVAARFRPDAG
jgi:uncharacterized protein YbaR (Trm112 family)